MKTALAKLAGVLKTIMIASDKDEMTEDDIFYKHSSHSYVSFRCNFKDSQIM